VCSRGVERCGARSNQVRLVGEHLVEHIDARRRNAGARSDERTGLGRDVATFSGVCRRECDCRNPCCR
jgi:hypothetical protein